MPVATPEFTVELCGLLRNADDSRQHAAELKPFREGAKRSGQREKAEAAFLRMFNGHLASDDIVHYCAGCCTDDAGSQILASA